MKNTKNIIALFALLAIGLFATSCGSAPQDPVTYNNKLMTLMNINAKDINAMNSAMTSGDYQKAEDVRKKWKDHLKKALKEANAVSDFKENNDLKTAVITGLESYQKIVSKDYKQLIAIRRKGDTSQRTKENELLGNINDAFSKAGKAVNTAESAFQAKFGQ